MSSVESTHMGDTSLHDRMFGLDLCRTMAVVSVVFGHVLLHSSPNEYLASIGFLAIFGVDLFFCLSGFLIGRILLQESSKWAVEKERGVIRFWYRRWMRTLPLYLFFLLIELNIYWGGASSISTQASYLVFSQNLAWPMSNFYSLTWSLSVEEWFYFLFPLIILLGVGFGKSYKAATAASIVIFLIVPPILRYSLFDTQGSFNNLDPNIRHVVVFRLDSIGFGVLIAYIDKWHKPFFERLSSFWWIFAALAVGCMIFIKWNYFGLVETNALATAYFSVSALAFAGLIPFFTGLVPTRVSIVNRFIEYTSLISYSLYLGHIVAFVMGMYLYRRLGVFEKFYPNPWITYLFFILLAYILATLTYTFVEKPFLALRDNRNPFKSKTKTIA